MKKALVVFGFPLLSRRKDRTCSILTYECGVSRAGVGRCRPGGLQDHVTTCITPLESDWLLHDKGHLRSLVLGRR